MLYTGNGDTGTSTLYKGNERIPKDDSVFIALGAVDELNTLLGVYQHQLKQVTLSFSLAEVIKIVQQQLFILQGLLAGAEVTLKAEHVSQLEKWIAETEHQLPPINTFVVPGATFESSLLDHLRAVTRRVEISIVAAQRVYNFDSIALQYVNRLSSVWYVLARGVTTSKKQTEESPHYS